MKFAISNYLASKSASLSAPGAFRAAAALLLLCLWHPLAAPAQAPANDFCLDAVVIPPNGPFPYRADLVPNISGATTNFDPLPPTNCVITVANGIWYRFEPAMAGDYTFSISYGTLTTVDDTAMALYSSTNDCEGPFALLECNDDRSSLRSAVSATLAANGAYFLLIWAAFELSPSSGTAVELLVTKPSFPTNDLCGGAEIISGAGPFPYFTAITDLTKASSTSDPPPPSCAIEFTNSIWYRFTPAATGSYVITSDTNSTATTAFDTVIGIYTSAGGCDGPFTPVACADIRDKPAILTNVLTAGTTYYIVVWDADPPSPTPGETFVQLRIFRQGQPTVATLAASGLTTNAAVLNGAVTPNGVSTRGWFEWGTSTNYGNVTAAPSLGSGTNAVSYNSRITGLALNVLYHYRAVATNLLGTTRGEDRTFVLFRIDSAMQLANGSFQLQFSGASGQPYSVWASTDLVAWTQLGAATETGGGRFSFTDASAASRRFYQVRSP